MNLPKEKLQNGDILCCTSYGWLGKQIKRFSKATSNHAAQVIKVSNVLMVIESQKNGTNPKTFENWLAAYGYDYKVFRYLYHNANWGKAIRERALSKSGVSGYGFKTLFVTFPLYYLTGEWFGTSHGYAEKRPVCSQYVAWVHELPNWWTMSPGDVQAFLENSKHYVLINP
jgi:hypothetical protein